MNNKLLGFPVLVLLSLLTCDHSGLRFSRKCISSSISIYRQYMKIIFNSRKALLRSNVDQIRYGGKIYDVHIVIIDMIKKSLK